MSPKIGGAAELAASPLSLGCARGPLRQSSRNPAVFGSPRRVSRAAIHLPGSPAWVSSAGGDGALRALQLCGSHAAFSIGVIGQPDGNSNGNQRVAVEALSRIMGVIDQPDSVIQQLLNNTCLSNTS